MSSTVNFWGKRCHCTALSFDAFRNKQRARKLFIDDCRIQKKPAILCRWKSDWFLEVPKFLRDPEKWTNERWKGSAQDQWGVSTSPRCRGPTRLFLKIVSFRSADNMTEVEKYAYRATGKTASFSTLCSPITRMVKLLIMSIPTSNCGLPHAVNSLTDYTRIRQNTPPVSRLIRYVT